MKFRPCIDLHNGQVKQIVGSTLDNSEVPDTNFISDKSSSYYAEMYRDNNLKGGHVIMLGPGNEKAALEAVSAAPSFLQVGGGLNANNGEIYLSKGASHLIFTSYVFADGQIKYENLEKLLKSYGKEKVVLDLSCRKKADGFYYIVTDRWQKFTNFKLEKNNLQQLSAYADEFLIHAVDVEGKKGGIDCELIKLISEISPITAVYAGGISKLDDIKYIYENGKNKIDFTIGSALNIFGGNLDYHEIIKYSQQLNKE
jgi:phosphoribosylformimino-5-aminoimidazole carboxamide ribotide isomerase